MPRPLAPLEPISHTGAFPGLTENDFATAGFHWHPGLNAYRRCFGDHSEYWLLCFGATAPGHPATVALILEETCFFERDLRTPADLTAAHSRAVAAVAEQAAECEAIDFQTFLNRQGLGQLFE